jgi:hypothetical protein
MTWTLTGTAALTLNGGVGTPINGANGMIINAGGLSGLFTLDASNTAETITLGSGGSLVNAWGGNDSVTGGSGADTVNGGDGDDTIQGGGAADVLNGGNGNFDTFRLGQLYAGLDGANDTVDGGAGTNDLLDLRRLDGDHGDIHRRLQRHRDRHRAWHRQLQRHRAASSVLPGTTPSPASTVMTLTNTSADPGAFISATSATTPSMAAAARTATSTSLRLRGAAPHRRVREPRHGRRNGEGADRRHPPARRPTSRAARPWAPIR